MSSEPDPTDANDRSSAGTKSRSAAIEKNNHSAKWANSWSPDRLARLILSVLFMPSLQGFVGFGLHQRIVRIWP
jgi:hypothetical protein